jgi:hypothetical protein
MAQAIPSYDYHSAQSILDERVGGAWFCGRT